MCVNRSMTLRYSFLFVSRFATPRCQPSTRASDQIQAIDAAKATGVSARQDSRSASTGP